MKIKIGKSSLPRRPFDASHDVHTTLDWGFMQPTCKLELIAGSTIDCNIGSMCRLMPLVAPTFGRAIIKHYAYFVPIREVCYQYENLISRTGFNGAQSTYIPKKVLRATLKDLSSVFLNPRFAKINVYTYESKIIGRSANHVEYNNLSNLGSFTSDVLDRFNAAERGGFLARMQAFMVDGVDSNLTPEGADFLIDTDSMQFHTDGYLLVVRLNKKGRNLRKVLIGLGYQVNFDETKEVSILPILAYYKAWFDLFAIKQRVNWQYTRAYKFIQYSAQNNVTRINNIASAAEVRNFFYELAECYYTLNPDYYTCQQDELVYMQQEQTNLEVVDAYATTTDGGVSDRTQIGATPYLIDASSNGNVMNPWLVKGLLKMLPFINKDSIIGAKVRERLRAHGYGTADDDKSTHFIGASSVNIDISDVMSTAETDFANLGEYTGKGFGDGASGSMKFSTSVPGFFIVLTTVVPRTGYYQGVDPTLFHGTNDEFDWYHPEWDAFGYQVTSGLEFIGTQDISNGLPSRNSNFGIIPRYSEYKCSAHDIVNGDMSLRSRQTELLPYHLSRLIGTGVTNYEYDDNFNIKKLSIDSTYINSVNESIRYIGKDEVFGNFNRIFQIPEEDDGTFNFDGFILHNIFNIKIIAPMKPMSESYDTDSQDNPTTVNKA